VKHTRTRFNTIRTGSDARMANVFLSHSSKDNDFVRRLADDLRELGHEPWLDEWKIRVGDCIVSKIQEGLARAEYVVLVLTPEAVASGWVDREWKDAYWSEIGEKRVIVLPVLLRACEVPPLLRTKKYADFTQRYELGLALLAQAFMPQDPNSAVAEEAAPRPQNTEELERVVSRMLKEQDERKARERDARARGAGFNSYAHMVRSQMQGRK
jgi:hypothetical protein